MRWDLAMEVRAGDVVVGDVAFFVDQGVPEFAMFFDGSGGEGEGLGNGEEVAFGERTDGEGDSDECGWFGLGEGDR